MPIYHPTPRNLILSPEFYGTAFLEYISTCPKLHIVVLMSELLGLCQTKGNSNQQYDYIQYRLLLYYKNDPEIKMQPIIELVSFSPFSVFSPSLLSDSLPLSHSCLYDSMNNLETSDHTPLPLRKKKKKRKKKGLPSTCKQEV